MTDYVTQAHKTKTIRLPLKVVCRCAKPSLEMRLEPYEQLEAKLQPEELMKPLRIFVHSKNPGGLIVLDIKCGRNSQFAVDRPVSSRHFTEETSRVFDKMDAIHVGQSFTVSIRSISEEPIDFSIEAEVVCILDEDRSVQSEEKSSSDSTLTQ